MDGWNTVIPGSTNIAIAGKMGPGFFVDVFLIGKVGIFLPAIAMFTRGSRFPLGFGPFSTFGFLLGEITGVLGGSWGTLTQPPLFFGCLGYRE